MCQALGLLHLIQYSEESSEVGINISHFETEKLKLKEMKWSAKTTEVASG